MHFLRNEKFTAEIQNSLDLATDFLDSQAKSLKKNSYLHANFHEEEEDLDKKDKSSIGTLSSGDDKGCAYMFSGKYHTAFEMAGQIAQDNILKTQRRIQQEEMLKKQNSVITRCTNFICCVKKKAQVVPIRKNFYRKFKETLLTKENEKPKDEIEGQIDEKLTKVRTEQSQLHTNMHFDLHDNHPQP